MNVKKVIFYGIGKNTINILKVFPEITNQIVVFIDNDIQKQKNSPLYSKNIVSVTDISQYNYDYIVITSLIHKKEMKDSLQKQGVTADKIIDFWDFLYTEYLYITDDGNLFVKKYIDKKDDMYIACVGGIGDTLYISLLAKSYKEYYHINGDICLIVKHNHRAIPDWFEGVKYKIVSTELTELLDSFSTDKQIWNLNNYIYGHFKKSFFKMYDEYYNSDDCAIVKYKKLILKIPEHCKLETPLLNKTISNYLETNNFNKQTIILMPYAKSITCIPMSFWKELAERLIEYGYNVFTNVKDDSEKAIPETTPIMYNIEETVKLCELCYCTITIRSGICDVLAFTDTKLIILNTDRALCEEWNIKYLIKREGINNLWVDVSDVRKNILDKTLSIVNSEVT